MDEAEELPREAWVVCPLSPWGMQPSLEQFPAQAKELSVLNDLLPRVRNKGHTNPKNVTCL